MRRVITMCFLLMLGTTACVEPVNTGQKESEAEAQPEALIDNLPISDRDLLLEPLESALDDLKAGIENSEVYFESNKDIERDGFSGILRYKLDGADTVMMDFEWENSAGAKEQNRYYFDKSGQLFYSEHAVENHVSLAGLESSSYELKFYHDNGALLSSYARRKFSDNEAEDWTPVCLTDEEERFWKGRRGALKAN